MKAEYFRWGENGGRREEGARFIPNSHHVVGDLISCFRARADMRFIRIATRRRIHHILVTGRRFLTEMVQSFDCTSLPIRGQRGHGMRYEVSANGKCETRLARDVLLLDFQTRGVLVYLSTRR